MIYSCTTETIVSTGTTVVIGTSNCCSCCGQPISNNPVYSYNYSGNIKSEPIFWKLSWRSRTIDAWRPYRRPISYDRFILPRVQRQKPKCRDPPGYFVVNEIL